MRRRRSIPRYSSKAAVTGRIRRSQEASGYWASDCGRQDRADGGEDVAGAGSIRSSAKILMGYRPGKSALEAIAVTRRRCWDHDWVVEFDIRGLLDAASHYPRTHEAALNSWGWRSITLIRSPFCLPRTMCTASSSPRLTRCNTVCRETPSARIASRMGRKSSPASPLNRATRASSNECATARQALVARLG